MRKREVLLRGQRSEVVLIEMPEACQVFYSFWRHCNACVVVLDLTQPDGLFQAHQYVMQWQTFCAKGYEKCVIVAGNKADSGARFIEHSDAAFLVASLRLLYIETSAKHGQNIDAAVKLAAEIALNNASVHKHATR
jgi:hypothetical protein